VLRSRLAPALPFVFSCYTYLDVASPTEVILSNVKASPDDTWWYWIVLCSQFFVFRLLALMVLRIKASRFY
jgi:hypothetical protein